MGETNIPWCHYTHNIAWGCHKVSDECKHCYAEAWSKRTGYNGQSQRAGGQGPIRAPLPVIWGPGPFTPRRTFGEKHWQQPLAWNRAAKAAGERRRVFCSSMADVFEDHPTLEQEREKLWPLIEQTPWLDWLLLTKRPENMVRMAPVSWWPRWPPNVWAGTTVGVRSSIVRLDWLRMVPAAVRFVSAEPLLEDLGDVTTELKGITWLILGGESGPKARPCDVEWIRSAMRCAERAETLVFVKQLGAKPYDGRLPVTVTVDNSVGVQPHNPLPSDASVLLRTGSLVSYGRVTWGNELKLVADAKGEDPSEWPKDLRVRQFPESGAFV